MKGRGPESINRLRRMQGPLRKLQRTIEPRSAKETRQMRRELIRGRR